MNSSSGQDNVLEVIKAVDAPVNRAGSVFMFAPETLARGKEIGLDGFRFYILGRGGVMGDVQASVVESAFGYFAGPLIAKMWDSAKERVAPADAAAAYMQCNAELGRARLGDVPGLEAYCAAVEQIVAATRLAGLPLFAGMAAAEVPQDLPAKAMHLTEVLRELRGSVHLLAIASVGLDNAVAHAIRRPDDVASFGYDPAPQITDDDRAKLAAADELTDQLLVEAFGQLDDSAAKALVDGAAAIDQALS